MKVLYTVVGKSDNTGHVWTKLPTVFEPLSRPTGVYGHQIPTPYKVKHNNRWKRVYCRNFGNSGSCYIMSKGEEIAISD